MDLTYDQGLPLVTRDTLIPTLDDIDEEAGLPVAHGATLQSSLESGPLAANKRPRHGFQCSRCGTSFTERRSLLRHERQTSCAGASSKEWPCDMCSRKFAREETRKRHKDERHLGLKRSQTEHKSKIKPTQPTTEIMVLPTEELVHSSLSPSNNAPHMEDFAGSSVPHKRFSFEPSSPQLELSDGPHDAADSTVEMTTQPLSLDLAYSSSPVSSRSMHSVQSARYDSGVDLAGSKSSQDDLVLACGFDSESADANVETVVSSAAGLTSDPDVRSTFGTPVDAELDDPDLWMSDLLDFDAIQSDHVDWLAWLPLSTETAADESGKDDDMCSVTSTESQPRASIRNMLGRMRSKRVAGPYHHRSTIRPHQRLLENCLYCAEPWERQETALRQHLDKHIQDLFSKANAFCGQCQVAFVSQEALERHQHAAAVLDDSSSLPTDHSGPCEGNPCGFDFKHSEQCNGHHPPSDFRGRWSGHDRLKYGQLMQELVAQAGALRVQAAKVDMHERVRRCLSNRSLPNPRKWRHSTASLVPSMFSWLSEPHGETYDVEELQLSLSRMTINTANRRSAVRRGLARIVGTQLELDTQLYAALSKNDLPNVARLVERGASCNQALTRALKRADATILRNLWLVAGTGLLTDDDLIEGLVKGGVPAVTATLEAGIGLSEVCALKLLYLGLHKIFGPVESSTHALIRLALQHIPNVNAPGLSKDAVLELRERAQQMTNIRLLRHNDESTSPLAWAAAGRDLEAARLLVAAGAIVDHITVLTVFNRNPKDMKQAWVETLLGHRDEPAQAESSQIQVS